MSNPYDIECAIDEAEDRQWSKIGNIYSPCPETVQKIPGGYYDCHLLYGKPQLSRQSFSLKGLLKLQSKNVTEVIEDIQSFWNKEKVYEQYKVPYKRGILLSGAPGTGKTCLIKIIMAEIIKKNGVCFDYYNPDILSLVLKNMKSIQPRTPILIIVEDVDSVEMDSDFLNFLDGVVELHNVVFMFTTNHPESLDNAFINRPGRVDAHYQIDAPSANIRRQFIKSMLSRGKSKLDIEELVCKTEGLSIGHIKELILAVIVFDRHVDYTIDMLRNSSIGREDSD